jgi:hypothetical protein
MLATLVRDKGSFRNITDFDGHHLEQSLISACQSKSSFFIMSSTVELGNGHIGKKLWQPWPSMPEISWPIWAAKWYLEGNLPTMLKVVSLKIKHFALIFPSVNQFGSPICCLKIKSNMRVFNRGFRRGLRYLFIFRHLSSYRRVTVLNAHRTDHIIVKIFSRSDKGGWVIKIGSECQIDHTIPVDVIHG